MKERIKNKLKDSKKISESKSTIENDEKKDENINEDVEVDEYYFGKDRDEERKKKAYVILFYYTNFKMYVKYKFVFLEKNDEYLYCLKFNLQHSNKKRNTRVKAQCTKREENEGTRSKATN